MPKAEKTTSRKKVTKSELKFFHKYVKLSRREKQQLRRIYVYFSRMKELKRINIEAEPYDIWLIITNMNGLYYSTTNPWLAVMNKFVRMGLLSKNRIGMFQRPSFRPPRRIDPDILMRKWGNVGYPK